MLPIEKIFDEKEGTGDSKIFNAQWYPQVTVVLSYVGGTTATMKLYGSLDKTTWVEVDAGGDNPTKLTSDHWYHYYKITLSANDRKVTATIGAAGA